MSKHFCFARSVAPIFASTIVETPAKRLALGLLVLALFCAPVARVLAQTPTPVTVPTWQYDLTHSGSNTKETALTLENVNVNSFGKLFPLPVDGTVYAQPLYVPGLTMSDGQEHNVLLVATENDTVYAFDADSNTGANANPIWKVTLLDAAHGAGAGATAVPWQDTATNTHNGSPDVAPTIGITGTPAIDPATNTLYVVAATKESGVYFSRLHAINILTGAERANSPVAITATVAGTGNGSTGGQLSFDALWQNQRPALDFYNGYVYIGYAAHGDYEPWHGWLFAYNATTLAQSAVICLSPNGFGSGIWSSGAGMPIDEDAPGGRMFVVTGNGTRTNGVKFPFSGSTGYGQSVIDFSLANGGLTATDEFTAFNYSTLNTGDLDLGSGGLLMPPDQQAQYPHMLLAGGKEGRTVVLNRDNLGGYAPGGTSNTNALQDIPNQTGGYWGTPAYWNGHVYMWAVPDKNDASGNPVLDVPKMFQLSDGVMGTAPTSQSTITSAWPGSTFSISSNDEQDGIAWAVRSDQFNTHGAAVLYAWDANDLTKPLYESDTNSKRDAAGAANRFAIPVVTNGKVYVAANGQVDVYGLFNDEPNAVAPVVTPNGGTFSTSQSVKLSTTTTSADIYYTLDGSVPTPSSTLYTGAITISTNTTVKAIATASGFVQSGVTSATFSFTGQAPSPSFLPAGGTYATAQQVTLSDTDTNAKIYYTTDGSAPSASSNLYSAPIQVAVSETIKAIAIDPSLQNSAVGTSTYTIQIAPAGTFSLSATATNAIAQGGSTTSTVTVTPSGGFTGSVALTCAITSSPSGAVNIPTCSVTQPAAISGTGPVTSTLTINTQAATSPGAYTATVTGSSGSVSKTTTVAITVNAPTVTPSFTLSATPTAPITQGGSTSSTVTVTPTGGFTGNVALTCAVTASPSGATDLPTCSATQPAPISGNGPVTSTLTISTQAATSPGIYTATVTGSSGSVARTTTVAITVAAPTVTPTVTLSATPTTAVAPGGSTTSTITITPSGGFTGNMALTCAVTASPSGAIDLPTCSATQPAAISGSGSVTSTITVNTTAASAASLHSPLQRIFNLNSGGTLAALLFFCLPFRRRRWQTVFGLLLFLGMGAAVIGCGGGGAHMSPGPANSGTTAGTYTVTVTAASGSTNAMTAVTVTVQ